MNISEFKKGDTIVRTQPAKSLGPMTSLMGEVIERTGDRSYMGEKMIYMGVANGQIYLRRTNELERTLFGDKPVDVSIDLWEDGWEHWIDPETLSGDDVYVKTEEPMSEVELIAKIDIAVSTENYEEADRLKKKLEGLRRN